MSDCSSEAMKPKEPPKTCGTCYWMMMQPGHGECGACGNPECGLERWPEAYGNGYYLYTTVDGDCEGVFWKPKKPDCDECPERLLEDGCKVKAHCYDLQERCQQLEQVAKKLYRRCWKEAARKSSALSTFMRNAHADDDMRPYREQLEALGVSVDDKQERA